VDPQTGEALMAQMEGPGCIWRIWSANPRGRIRFYLDGDTKPTYELDFNAIFAGKVPGFPRPLIWQRKVDLGGNNPASNCYMPIPFAKSCKVTMDKAHTMLYYHIGYATFPKNWNIKTFNLKRTESEEATLQRVCNILKNCGQDPQPAGYMKVDEKTVTLDPGRETVWTYTGKPATIRQFYAKLKSDDRWARRKVLLQMYWDKIKTPAVEAPIGDFFGDAWDEATYKSLPMGITDDLNYCFWRMPFGHSARIVFSNQGKKLTELRYKIAYTQQEHAPTTAHFYAKWRRDPNSSVFDYPMLECTGYGRFVGVVLYPDNIMGGWWGEGDEKIYVDGEKFPSYFGTGSEDYFGDAWGYRYFVNPYHGCPSRRAYNEGRHQSAYRWHVSDNIPFNKSFKIDIENYAAKHGKKLRNDYSSMAYWYQKPGSDFFKSVPVEERIPAGPINPRAIEAEKLVDPDKLPQGVSIISEDDLPQRLCSGKGLKISGPAGTTATVNLPAKDDDRYLIKTVMAQGVPSSKFELLQEGQPITEHLRLNKGNNPIQVRLTGQPVEGSRCQLIIDYFMLEPYRKWAPAWYLIGPFDNTKGKGVDRDFGPETEPFNPNKTYPAKTEPVKWKKYKVAPGMVHQGGNYFPQTEHIALYAYTEVISPDVRKTKIYVGSDDTIKIWLNGQQVHSFNKPRGCAADQDRIPVNLKKGRNTILLKITNYTGPWGFMFRLQDPDNKLKYALPE
ncbi:MAG: glycoside hydrolase family 172 protein, partial [Planctomycetota bacterium]